MQCGLMQPVAPEGGFGHDAAGMRGRPPGAERSQVSFLSRPESRTGGLTRPAQPAAQSPPASHLHLTNSRQYQCAYNLCLLKK